MPSQRPAGAVRAQRADLDDGQASATIRMRRRGIAVLSASYDPGWTATVNGGRQPIRMIAPALVAVDVPAGTDQVVFCLHGYDHYPELLALSAATLAIIAVTPVCVRRTKIAARQPVGGEDPNRANSARGAASRSPITSARRPARRPMLTEPDPPVRRLISRGRLLWRSIEQLLRGEPLANTCRDVRLARRAGAL